MEDKHKILWLGSFKTKEQFERMPAKTIGQASGYASEKGIIKGLDAALKEGYVLDTVSLDAYPPYPIYPSLFVKKDVISRNENSLDVSVGYFNIKYFNYIFRSLALFKEVVKWSRSRIGTESNTIYVYAPSVTKLKAAIYLKNKYKAKVFVIIPDVPEFVNLEAPRIIRFMKKKTGIKMRKQFELVDGFILYSSKMAEYYNIPQNKWILMEGVFDPEEANTEYNYTEKSSNAKKIMYSGALDKNRGIPQLLEAFMSIENDDYELWLTGAGRSDELIYSCIEKDKRIKHFGYLDSREDVLKLQSQADVLVHTRDINSPAAPYCFPSKLFEYLVAGKSVISVRLDGIPNEYFDYMIPIESLSVDDIKAAIIAALKDQEENAKRAERARNFVLETKNSYVQAKKILKFSNTPYKNV